MASRRLKSDRFFTNDYTPDVYTPEGLDWIEGSSMVDVLLRHHPELGPALEGCENAFAPWRTLAVGGCDDAGAPTLMPELPSASLAESVQFNQLVIVPNAVQGIFRRRRTPVARRHAHGRRRARGAASSAGCAAATRRARSGCA